MKYIIFLAGVVFLQMISIALGEKQMLLECAKELGITEDMLKEDHETNRGKPEFHCFHTCLMKKSGVLEAGNKLNFDKMKEHGSKLFGDKIDAIIKAKQECAEESKAITDECDFIRAVDECTLKKVPELQKMLNQLKHNEA